LVENRQLFQRVERSGLFEEKRADLGGALVAALDRQEHPRAGVPYAQLALAADSVILWMATRRGTSSKPSNAQPQTLLVVEHAG